MLRKQKHLSDQPPRRRASSRDDERMTSPQPTQASFRRNRTISGSTSSAVSSLMTQNGQLKSPRAHAHDLARLRHHLGLLLGGVVLVCIILLVLISQFTARVTVSLSGLSHVKPHASYEEQIQSYFGRYPIERLRFMTNMKGLTAYMQQQSPEIEELSLQPSGQFATGHLTVTARKPVTGWTVRGAEQYVDAKGISFDRNYYKRPTLEIVDNSGIPAEAGQAITSNRFLGFIGRLIGQTHADGYKVTQVILPSGTTRQIELRIKGVPYRIKCTIDRSAGEQAEDIDRVVKYLKHKGRTPGYVDVRVSGKAYYQ